MTWALALNTFKIPGGVSLSSRSAPTFVKGRKVSGSVTNTTLDPVVIQPANGRDLQFLPEGIRSNDVIRLYTTTELNLIGEPDRITYRAKTYELIKLSAWADNRSDGWFKYLAREVD